MTPEFFNISSGRLRLKTTSLGASAAALFYAPYDFSLIKELQPEAYLVHRQHFGAIAGPIANRIAEAKLTLNGRDFLLERNEGETCLHSGNKGLGRQLWQVALHEKDRIIFSLDQPDGALGFPGNRRFECQYRLSHKDGDECLSVDLTMTSDQDTFCNMTFHPYFCLDNSGIILSHQLYVDADGYLEKDTDKLPTGNITPLSPDGLGFNPAKPLSFLMSENQSELDHHFCLNLTRDQNHPVAVLYSALSSIEMKIETNQPGMQIYAPKSLDPKLKDPEGKAFKPFSSICVESQKWPDAARHPHFPSIVVKANEPYQNLTVFKFNDIKG
jgi:aldose 1-epimerase